MEKQSRLFPRLVDAVVRAWCGLRFHKLKLHKHIKGSHEAMNWRALLVCERCGSRFVMSEQHQAFVRYDDDPDLQRSLLVIYPELTANDL